MVMKVQAAMMGDSECPEKESERIERQYQQATPIERKAIDDFCISLCGYSVNTLLSGRVL